MEVILYALGKIVAYGLLCYLGVRVFKPRAGNPITVSIALGLLRFGLGLLFALPIYLVSTKVYGQVAAAQASEALTYLTVYVPVRWAEWSIEILQGPGDRAYGLRDYRIRDLNGYELGFGHHIFNIGPSVEIERVDVPVRLEKRLAALLRDLAEYKHMSVNSCLEETLLHTLEGVGPHTKADLRQIEKLKHKHGIDYDSHASYRFVEAVDKRTGGA